MILDLPGEEICGAATEFRLGKRFVFALILYGTFAYLVNETRVEYSYL